MGLCIEATRNQSHGSERLKKTRTEPGTEHAFGPGLRS